MRGGRPSSSDNRSDQRRVPAVWHQSQQDQARQRLAVANRKLSEVLVARDEDSALGAAERQNSLVMATAIDLEHVVHVVPRSPKRGGKARIATLVEQQPHGLASTAAFSAE
jgi:hypothetical protein